MEAALARFRAADTQVLGVSVDSIHSHANWAKDGGGVSFPLLADFQPKGAMAQSFGHYLADAGITDRATVVLDKSGTVRYSASVGPGGERNIDELIAECEKVNKEHAAPGGLSATRPVPAGTTLFVKSACGHSRRALLALDNLHLRDVVQVRNVTEDAAAATELKKVGGKDQAPCLVVDGQAMYESGELIHELANRHAPVGG